jgi:hypothetical protein
MKKNGFGDTADMQSDYEDKVDPPGLESAHTADAIDGGWGMLKKMDKDVHCQVITFWALRYRGCSNYSR